MKKYGKITALIAGVVLALGFASCKADIDDDSTFYTVTFNSMGGTEISSQSIESGKKATKPTDPSKTETATEVFVFAGWYTSTDGGTTLSDTTFDFDTVIEGDISLYAKCNVYTIEYIELKDCSEIRTMFETLCEYINCKFKKTITRFAKADARSEAAEYYIDAKGNQIPLWYDEEKTTLYYYLEPGKKMTLRTSDGKNSLFEDMSDAVSIETGDFDTSKVTDMSNMFCLCEALITITASEKFVTDKVTDSSYMFENCTSLKGGAGTVYDENHIDQGYARIDGGTEEPGYFTKKQ